MAISDLIQWFSDRLQETPVDIKEFKDRGGKVVGIYCGFVPCELIRATGAIAVTLCGNRNDVFDIAEKDLPRNFCPLIKSSYGLAVSGKCPFFYFSDALVGETTCDGKKKVFELMADLKPLHVMQLPFRPQDADSKDLWMREIRRLAGFIEQQTGGTITPEGIGRAIHQDNEVRVLLQEASATLRADDPPITWVDLLKVVSLKDFMVDQEEYKAKLRELNAALHAAVAAGGNGNAGKPRILVTGAPMMPRTAKVMTLAEEAGAAVVVHDACSGTKGFAYLTDETADPWEALMERTLKAPCACMSPNPGRFEVLKRSVADYNVQGIIDNVWMTCHTFNVESTLVQRFVDKELHIPYMKLETDYTDHDDGQLRTRIGAFVEMLT